MQSMAAPKAIWAALLRGHRIAALCSSADATNKLERELEGSPFEVGTGTSVLAELGLLAAATHTRMLLGWRKILRASRAERTNQYEPIGTNTSSPAKHLHGRVHRRAARRFALHGPQPLKMTRRKR